MALATPSPTAPPVPSASVSSANAGAIGSPSLAPSNYYTPPPASLQPPLSSSPNFLYYGWSGLGNPKVTQGNEYNTQRALELGRSALQSNPYYNNPTGGVDPTVKAITDYLNFQYQTQQSALERQLGQHDIEGDYQTRLHDLNEGALRGDYDLQLQRIASQQAQNADLPRADIAANRSYLDALAKFLPQTRALNAQTRDNAYGRSQLDYDAQRRNSLSDAVGRGAVNSQGLRDSYDELSRQLGLSRGSADIQYGRSSLDTDRDQAALTRDNALLDNRNKMLDQVAKDYGIDRLTAERALQTGLQKLGLDFEGTMRKISESTGETRRQLDQLAPMLWQQALALAGQG